MKNSSILTNWNDLPLTFDANQLANILGISKPLAYNLINSDGFPSITLGRKRRVVPKDQFKLWLEKQALSTSGR